MNSRDAQSSKLVAHTDAWPAAAKQPVSAPDEQPYTRSKAGMSPAASSTRHIPADDRAAHPAALHHERDDVSVGALAGRLLAAARSSSTP